MRLPAYIVQACQYTMQTASWQLHHDHAAFVGQRLASSSN
jgi:hypothetical protein